jgi:hypothetical protein
MGVRVSLFIQVRRNALVPVTACCEKCRSTVIALLYCSHALDADYN